MDYKMNKRLSKKLKNLPASPGIYFFKNDKKEIIYIGKAAKLNNRVRQYFQKSRLRDTKTELLISEIVDFEITQVDSETEALFLEAEMVKRYLPKYNILLRDDKSLTFIRINSKEITPSVLTTRRPIDDGADYFGPFLQAGPTKKALRVLRRIFPYSIHSKLPNRACLDYHLGLCPGPETDSYNENEYKKNLKQLSLYIRGKRSRIVKDLESQMQKASNNQDFETALIFRNKIISIKMLQNKIIFGDRESIDLSKDYALSEIAKLFGFNLPPKRIEAYDISHIQGADVVASMVVFTNGVPSKSEYRKFKIAKDSNDDYLNMKVTISRRFSPNNVKKWGNPDLLLIDGGKGQLGSVINVLNDLNLKIPAIGLTKRTETIIVNKSHLPTLNDEETKKLNGQISQDSANFITVDLPEKTHTIKLFQRIRDESHRFALNYHSVLRQKRQMKSLIDDIPGVGAATKNKLLKYFGSVRNIKQSDETDIAKVVGKSKAKAIKQYIND
jgi:excinuclease ABC subunit C